MPLIDQLRVKHQVLQRSVDAIRNKDPLLDFLFSAQEVRVVGTCPGMQFKGKDIEIIQSGGEDRVPATDYEVSGLRQWGAGATVQLEVVGPDGQTGYFEVSPQLFEKFAGETGIRPGQTDEKNHSERLVEINNRRLIRRNEQ